jgi:hypothetical protein
MEDCQDTGCTVLGVVCLDIQVNFSIKWAGRKKNYKDYTVLYALATRGPVAQYTQS